MEVEALEATAARLEDRAGREFPKAVQVRALLHVDVDRVDAGLGSARNADVRIGPPIEPASILARSVVASLTPFLVWGCFAAPLWSNGLPHEHLPSRGEWSGRTFHPSSA